MILHDLISCSPEDNPAKITRKSLDCWCCTAYLDAKLDQLKYLELRTCIGAQLVDRGLLYPAGWWRLRRSNLHLPSPFLSPEFIAAVRSDVEVAVLEDAGG